MAPSRARVPRRARGPGRARPLLSAARWSVVGSLLVLAVGATAAAAGECGPSAPLCTIEEVTGEADAVVEDTLEDGALGDVSETVRGTTETVTRTVEGTLGGVGGEPPPVGPQPPGGADDPAPPPGSGDPSAAADRRASVAGASGRRGPSDPPERFVAAVVTETSSTSGTREQGFLGELGGRALREVAGRLAFPLVLLFAIGLFLLVQDRIDRRDPRLALAPRIPDVVPFR